MGVDFKVLNAFCQNCGKHFKYKLSNQKIGQPPFCEQCLVQINKEEYAEKGLSDPEVVKKNI